MTETKNKPSINKKSTIDNIKKWVGVFGLFVGAIYSVIQIYNFFCGNDEFKLVATGDHFIYKIPALDNQKIKLENYELIEIKNNNPELNKLKDDTIQKLIEIGKNTGINKYTEKLNEFNSLWIFKIKNDGNKKIEEIYLETPFKKTFFSDILSNSKIPFDSGLYLITKKGEENKNGATDKDGRIKIGTLLPNYEATITLWAKNYFSSSDILNPNNYEERETKVTFSNGWIKIDYPQKSRGASAWIVKYWWFINTFIISSLFSVLLFLILNKIEKKYHTKINKNL